MQRWQMHENLTKLHDLLGGCERILRTPIPVAYTRHTTRCLILWLTVMPYALWGDLGWGTVIAAPLISFLLAGINEIGIDVEEPFSLLPLEAIADRAKMDCHEIISMQVYPAVFDRPLMGTSMPVLLLLMTVMIVLASPAACSQRSVYIFEHVITATLIHVVTLPMFGLC